jgi:hypothetical protein
LQHTWRPNPGKARSANETIFEEFCRLFEKVSKNNELHEENICSGCLYVVVLYITISPSHRNTAVTGPKDLNTGKETIMTTSISTKLAALALALMFNSVIMGGIAYLFNAQLQQPTAVTALASAVATSANDLA